MFHTDLNKIHLFHKFYDIRTCKHFPNTAPAPLMKFGPTLAIKWRITKFAFNTILVRFASVRVMNLQNN